MPNNPTTRRRKTQGCRRSSPSVSTAPLSRRATRYGEEGFWTIVVPVCGQRPAHACQSALASNGSFCVTSLAWSMAGTGRTETSANVAVRPKSDAKSSPKQSLKPPSQTFAYQLTGRVPRGRVPWAPCCGVMCSLVATVICRGLIRMMASGKSRALPRRLH